MMSARHETLPALGLAPGDWFQITAKSHFAHGEIHQAMGDFILAVKFKREAPPEGEA